jgi:hypothetical protein
LVKKSKKNIKKIREKSGKKNEISLKKLGDFEERPYIYTRNKTLLIN